LAGDEVVYEYEMAVDLLVSGRLGSLELSRIPEDWCRLKA
jgi:hypothetical protein